MAEENGPVGLPFNVIALRFIIRGKTFEFPIRHNLDDSVIMGKFLDEYLQEIDAYKNMDKIHVDDFCDYAMSKNEFIIAYSNRDWEILNWMKTQRINLC